MDEQEQVKLTIEDKVKNEQERIQIKSSDQFFIQNNYQKLTLEQICLATELAPDTVTEYIEEYQEYLKSQGVSIDNKFRVNIALNSDGVVSYGLEWPDINSIEPMLEYVGKFFYLLNSGGLKQSIVAFLNEYARERSTYRLVQTILNHWNEQDQANKNKPLVEPQEVFGE
jgi:hypothetical protein